MACFLVPATEALVVTAIELVVKKKESTQIKAFDTSGKNKFSDTDSTSIPLSRKLSWLTYLLWGGAFLLMFEHVWHGEVVPFFPFLTAMSSPGDTAAMLHEMSTIGVTMAILVTVAWIGILAAVQAILRTAQSRMHTA